jgi:hypothetical protein
MEHKCYLREVGKKFNSAKRYHWNFAFIIGTGISLKPVGEYTKEELKIQ